MPEGTCSGLILPESGQRATKTKPGGGVVFVRNDPFLRHAEKRLPLPIRFQRSGSEEQGLPSIGTLPERLLALLGVSRALSLPGYRITSPGQRQRVLKIPSGDRLEADDADQAALCVEQSATALPVVKRSRYL